MRYLLVFMLSCVLGASVAAAYSVVQTEISEPYEIVPIAADEYNQQALLGTLKGYPIMYEFHTDEAEEISVQMVAKSATEDPQFSLMIVRTNDDDSGVTEVARLMAKDAEWTPRKDKTFGMTFKESKILTLQYEPGTYRLEVSTPINEGPYMLLVGSSADHLGYWQTLSQVRSVQKHFGYSIVRLLGSSYVYYPLGIIFLLWVIRRTWKLRNSISNVT